MPYKDPEKRRALNRKLMEERRKDPAYREKEAKQKAEYFLKHKAEYRERLRQHRSKIREQSILNFTPENDE